MKLNKTIILYQTNYFVSRFRALERVIITSTAWAAVTVSVADIAIVAISANVVVAASAAVVPAAAISTTTKLIHCTVIIKVKCYLCALKYNANHPLWTHASRYEYSVVLADATNEIITCRGVILRATSSYIPRPYIRHMLAPCHASVGLNSLKWFSCVVEYLVWTHSGYEHNGEIQSAVLCFHFVFRKNRGTRVFSVAASTLGNLLLSPFCLFCYVAEFNVREHWR